MNEKKIRQATNWYLYLSAVFIAALVASNLIFQKFIYWHPFGDLSIFGAPIFYLSVGILPYPITFLITDLISEVYGRKKANRVVTAGIFASVFSMGLIYLANVLPAIDSSPVNDEIFSKVFALSPVGVLASMIAYLCAQYVDIAIYHFWKRTTKGRMLWLRNNFSTFTSQIIDTNLVVLLLCAFGALPWSSYWGLVISGVLFKVLVALVDTPFLYMFVGFYRKHFGLKMGEELTI